jgi:molybdopterin molybdotransferase
VLSVEEARERMVSGLPLVATERLPLDRCLGRVPASFSVTAAIDVPPFANSAMDGCAVRAADLPGELSIAGEVAAGAGSLPEVEPGTTVRIMTGAPMPPGTDTVVPIEVATELERRVRLPDAPQGQYVRAAGHDTRRGDAVELPAAPLAPASIAVLASLGIGEIEVRQRPIAAILSTGDELVEPGQPLGPGQIYDANSVGLAASVAETGGEARRLAIAGDDAALIERRLRDGAEGADLLVVSGGVSVGRHDHVRTAIEALGELGFWRIAMQPGKPLAFGRIGDVPVIGLPGNPVSALVTFELFVRPMLRALQGLPGDGRARVQACAAERMPKDTERRAYLRVRLVAGQDGYRAEPAGGQQSSQLRPLAAANALLVVPEGASAAEPGQRYEAIVLGAVA